MSSKRVWICYLAVGFSLSCSTVPVRSAPPPSSLPPAPSETPQAPPTDSSRRGPWAFDYSSGRATYMVRRSATIQRTDSISLRDTTPRNATSTTVTHEAVTFQPEADGIRITAVVDSSTFVPSDSAAQFSLHPQISAVLTANALTIDSTNETVPCSAIGSALISDVRNLVVAFPDSLTEGRAWKDSVNIKGCQAGIPTSSQVTRSFLVRGEIPIEGRLALQVTRSDTAQLGGEGGLQRHRVSIHALGTGTATYYLDVATGQVLRLDINQVLNVDVITLATKSQFQQHLEQMFVLSP
jgi:hypothetical protein